MALELLGSTSQNLSRTSSCYVLKLQTTSILCNMCQTLMIRMWVLGRVQARHWRVQIN
ncbi:hypothetical protein Golax_014319 [Gossypium laxum]|uniref:Uncharacterized protein n=1 Tax=Gossypium laxum TaxID=34288 RepID=A0A7J8ZUW5_9ROSI|nr:hypothetical protein [Gossypium laxum]